LLFAGWASGEFGWYFNYFATGQVKWIRFSPDGSTNTSISQEWQVDFDSKAGYYSQRLVLSEEILHFVSINRAFVQNDNMLVWKRKE
jgi:hypothetical protein